MNEGQALESITSPGLDGGLAYGILLFAVYPGAMKQDSFHVKGSLFFCGDAALPLRRTSLKGRGVPGAVETSIGSYHCSRSRTLVAANDGGIFECVLRGKLYRGW